MSIISILPKEITLPTSMIDMLNGNSMFWVENPYFQVPLSNFKYNDKLCKKNDIKLNGNKKSLGNRFHTPRLLMKHNDKFTQFFNIHYTENNKLTKIFNVRKPYLSSPDDDSDKYKHNISFIPWMKDKYNCIVEQEDEIMIKLDQLYMNTLELIFTCEMIGYKITNEKTDKEIINNICNYLKQPDAINYLSEKYFDINSLKIYYKDDGIYKLVTEDDELEQSLFSLLRRLLQMKNKELSNKILPDYKNIINKPNCLLVPCFKIIKYDIPQQKRKDEHEFGYNIDIPLRFYIKNQNYFF